MQGAALLRSLRYGDGLYFTADTLEGVNVVLLGRDSEGKSRWELVDSHGLKVIQEMNRVARGGGGFVDFWFPRITRSTPTRSPERPGPPPPRARSRWAR